jgi:hypothetical protein
MIRIATLLPAFTLAIALATTGVAFAAGGASRAAHDRTAAHSNDQDAAYKNACGNEHSAAYSCNLQSPHNR